MRPGAISRRQFVLGAGASSATLLAACGRLPWQAQQPAKDWRLGLLLGGSPDWSPGVAAFLQRLAEQGYTEGQNLTLEYRSAQFDYSRLPDLADDVRLPVDVILARDTPSAFAAAQATSTIPIVTVGEDPVRDRLADSYARPGHTVTGITVLNAML